MTDCLEKKEGLTLNTAETITFNECTYKIEDIEGVITITGKYLTKFKRVREQHPLLEEMTGNVEKIIIWTHNKFLSKKEKWKLGIEVKGEELKHPGVRGVVGTIQTMESPKNSGDIIVRGVNLSSSRQSTLES
jgi:hypothetical protein